MKIYSAITVANEILLRAKEKGIEISHLKLQKLVYYAHAWHLVFFKRPLIKEEVQAWKYGPVIPRLFYKLSKWKNENINENITDEEEQVNFDENEKIANVVLDKIMEIYGCLSPGKLSALAHSPNSAWGRTRQFHEDGNIKDYVLPNDLIGITEGEVLEQSENTESSRTLYDEK